uniref:Putative secreted protein n=1 Tax=Rhipicephalus microplus TaxID=6941 RepID=A0A6M2DAJ2_RHIMP
MFCFFFFFFYTQVYGSFIRPIFGCVARGFDNRKRKRGARCPIRTAQFFFTFTRGIRCYEFTSFCFFFGVVKPGTSEKNRYGSPKQ